MTKKFLALGLAIVLIAMVAAAIGCGGGLPKNSVAKVGTVLITQDQFNARQTQYVNEGKAPDKSNQPGEWKAFQQGVAGYLVMMEVLKQEAPSSGVTVTDAEVKAQLDTIKQMFQGDEKKFADSLKAQKLTLDELNQNLHDKLLFTGMQAVVFKDITVTDEESQAYYDAHLAEFVRGETRTARHILIAPVKPSANGTATAAPTAADWAAAKSEADKVRSEIQNGADFAAEAKKYSDDATTKASGGSLGPVRKGQMVPAFEQALFALNKGELSQPVKTEYGYHIIQVTEITPQKQLSYDEARETVRAKLLTMKQDQAWSNWLSKAESELGVSYRAGLQPAASTITTSRSLSTSTTSRAPDDTSTTSTAPDDTSTTGPSSSQSTTSTSK
ncbi:MAG TPA: peptidylprolyl isomerase [Thermoleophilia bacterium]